MQEEVWVASPEPGHGGDCMTATNMANRREYHRLT